MTTNDIFIQGLISGFAVSLLKYRRVRVRNRVAHAMFWAIGALIAGIVFIETRGPSQKDQSVQADQVRSHAESSVNLFEAKQQKQSEIDRLKTEIAGLESEVTRQYAQLASQRKALNANSKAEVERFNSAAAGYSKNNQMLAEKKGQLDRLWKELDGLNAQSDVQARGASADR